MFRQRGVSQVRVIAVRGPELQRPPVVAKQLDRMRSANDVASTLHRVGGAEKIAAPAHALGMFGIAVEQRRRAGGFLGHAAPLNGQRVCHNE